MTTQKLKFFCETKETVLSKKEKMKIYYEKNKDKIALRTKSYKDKNKDKVREWQNKQTQKRKQERKTPEGKLKYYKRNAKQRNRQWNLTDEQFFELVKDGAKCKYCGRNENIGVDCINSKQGYTEENCVPCCWPCNHMKSDFDVQEFLKLCKLIAEYNK